MTSSAPWPEVICPAEASHSYGAKTQHDQNHLKTRSQDKWQILVLAKNVRFCRLLSSKHPQTGVQKMARWARKSIGQIVGQFGFGEYAKYVLLSDCWTAICANGWTVLCPTVQ